MNASIPSARRAAGVAACLAAGLGGWLSAQAQAQGGAEAAPGQGPGPVLAIAPAADLPPELRAVPDPGPDPVVPEGATNRLNYVLGAAVGLGPAYTGSDERKTALRPVLALEYGRFRLSSSRGGSLMGYGIESREAGASVALAQRERFSLTASLRIDGGRSSSDATRLTGLPDVRTTLRGRLGMGYALSERWSLGAGLSQDLLGRSGGAQGNVGLRYVLPITAQTQLGMGVGAAFADGTYMRGRFGVPASAAGTTSPLPFFDPGGGLYGVDAGMDLMVALNRHWVAFGGVGVSQLRGDARRSPLTVRATSYNVSAGVAYRCCR
ncbi:MipA/OmpV family protein [Acidovorax sp. SRB_14]|uniref:MipA/OmpV family protein n=1 Tax=Acidovorax sp. SRB_14 TaxID=1962699 RepID=UPI001C208957|nr:MipA/OmpV family protein [Acidovorax sp. SRB_14]